MSVYMNKYALSFGTGNSSPRSMFRRGRTSRHAHIGAPLQDGFFALVQAGGRILQRVRSLLARRTTLSSFITLRGAEKPISVEPAGSAVAFTALSGEVPPASPAAAVQSFIGKSWTMEGSWELVNSSIVHNGRLSSGRKTFYPPTPYLDLATHKLAAAAYHTAQSHIAE